MNETPSANRLHIGFFGRRNVGKSSVVNAVTGQNLAVVSDVLGTTTDPVTKAMELLPIGPVLIIDTPGYDDEGTLGELRVKKTKQILNKTDVAVLVTDAAAGLGQMEKELLDIFDRKQIPYLVVYNKTDLLEDGLQRKTEVGDREIYVSAKQKIHIHELKEMIAAVADTGKPEKHLVSDLICPGDLIVLVTPIDSSAPKGRLILPQQQVIRDILDAGAISVVIRETELEETLERLGQKPALVITDSQVFPYVSERTPDDVKLTSFSILMARYKGILESAVKGAAKLSGLRENDRVLIAEGCTHHRQCEDIGTVKLPGWLQEYTEKKLRFDFTSGTEFPENLSDYQLIIHCGGCMLNEREMLYRIKCAEEVGIPITNYGTAIAQMHGILKRSLAVVPDIQKII